MSRSGQEFESFRASPTASGRNSRRDRLQIKVEVCREEMSEVGFRVCRLRRRIFVVAVCPQFGIKCRGRALRATVRVKSIRLRARFPLGQCPMMKIRS